MANGLETRVEKLEKALPPPVKPGFSVSIRPVVVTLGDDPLDDDDPRLVRGVEEFIYVHPEGAVTSGRREKRGRGYISPWCSVEFWGGGDRKRWNRVLKELRGDDDYYRGTGVMASFNLDAKGQRLPGSLIIRFGIFTSAKMEHLNSRWYRPAKNHEA